MDHGLLSASEAASANVAVVVKIDAASEWWGDIYYKGSRLECWLDGEPVYQGPIKTKGDSLIFNKEVSSGPHLLKMRWKAKARGAEAARVKLGGRETVGWINVPEQGFAEKEFEVRPGRRLIITARIKRRFGLRQNKSGIEFVVTTR